MAKPKLALIPATQGSKLYSVLPADGVGDFTFSRGSAATRINKDGLIETVASGVSRLNYPLIDGVVNGCPSHLLEPASTNLITYSEDFSDASWIKLGAGTGSAAVVTPNYSISPDGTQNATRLQCDLNGGTTSSDQSLVYVIPSGSSNTYTNSFYVKGVSGQAFAIGRDLNNKKIILTDGTWQKVDFSYTNTPIIFIGSRGTYGSDDVLDIQIFAAQLEQQSYATSYISTSGSAVTRSAETATNSADASTFNDSDGVLMAEVSALHNELISRTISINSGSSNRVFVQFRASGTEVLSGVVVGGLVQGSTMPLSISQTSNIKLAIKYKLNDFAFWVNGFEVGTSSGNVFPNGTLNDLSFDSGDGAEDFYGNTKQLQYFDSALNDSDLETLTSWVSFTDLANGQLYSIK